MIHNVHINQSGVYSASVGGVLYSKELNINEAGKRIPGLKEFSRDEVRAHDNIR